MHFVHNNYNYMYTQRMHDVQYSYMYNYLQRNFFLRSLGNSLKTSQNSVMLGWLEE